MNAQFHRERPDLQLVPPLDEPAAAPRRSYPGSMVSASLMWDALAPAGLTVTHRDRGATSVLTLAGEADLSTRDELAVGLQHALQRVPSALVVDVSRLEFCDSRSATAVIEANLNSPRTEVVLVGSHGMVRRVFDLLDPRQTLTRHP